MKLTVNRKYERKNGAEIATVERISTSRWYGALWLATLASGGTLTLFSDEILVSA